MTGMQRVVPHLWYDKEAAEAAALYVSVFEDSRIRKSFELSGTPSGAVRMVSASISDLEFAMLSAGSYFTFTPAVSFLAACKTKGEVDRLWSMLSAGGSVLMELGAYPFSERYGWLQGRYGLSWQIVAAGGREIRQRIIPTLMFTGAVAGRAEEAIKRYTSIFDNARVSHIDRYGKNDEPDKEGTVRHAALTLDGVEFAAMDSARPHHFTFTEAEQCGWLKDGYGLSWQIVPVELERMLEDADKRKVERVTQAFLKMKKLDLDALRSAYRGT